MRTGDSEDVDDARMEQWLAAHQHDGAEVAPYALDGRQPPQIALVFLHVKAALLRQWREVQAASAAQVAVVAHLHVENGLCVHYGQASAKAHGIGKLTHGRASG